MMVESAKFANDSNLLILGRGQWHIILLTIEGSKLVKTLSNSNNKYPTDSPVLCLSQDGRYLLTGAKYASIDLKLWDLETYHMVHDFAPQSPVCGARFLEQTETIVVAFYDSIIFYERDSFNIKKQIQLNSEKGLVQSFSISSDGQYLLTGTEWQQVVLCELGNRSPLILYEHEYQTPIFDFDFINDERYFAICAV